MTTKIKIEVKITDISQGMLTKACIALNKHTDFTLEELKTELSDLPFTFQVSEWNADKISEELVKAKIQFRSCTIDLEPSGKFDFSRIDNWELRYNEDQAPTVFQKGTNLMILIENSKDFEEVVRKLKSTND